MDSTQVLIVAIIAVAVACVCIPAVLGLIWLFKAQHTNPLGVWVKRFIALNVLESFATPAVVLILGHEDLEENLTIIVLIAVSVSLALLLPPLSSLRWQIQEYRNAALQVLAIGLTRVGLAAIFLLAVQSNQVEFFAIFLVLLVFTILGWFLLTSIQRQVSKLE